MSAYASGKIGLPLAGNGGNIPSVDSVNNPVATNAHTSAKPLNSHKTVSTETGFTRVTTGSLSLVLIAALIWVIYK